jgi:hypothetical protein
MSTYNIAYASPLQNTIFLNTYQQDDSSNTLNQTSAGTIVSLGDIALLNGTKNRIFFNNVGSGLPNVSSRSLGSKILFNCQLGGTNVDTAIGVNGTSLWLSAATTSSLITFHTGNVNATTMTNLGLILSGANQISNTINTLSTSSNASLICQGDILLYNSSKNRIFFSANGTGTPALTTRSDGYKLVLLPNISSSDTDIGIGTGSSSNLWLGTVAAGTIDTWHGATKSLSFSNTCLTIYPSTTTTNTLNTPTGSFFNSGDMVNNSALYFKGTSLASPAFTNRTSGSRIVLSASISSSSTDTAIGLETAGLWVSVPTTSQTCTFYTGTQKAMVVGTTTTVLDTTGTTQISINPCVEDVIVPQSFSASTSPVTTAANVTGLKFTNSKTRAFTIELTVSVVQTSGNLYQFFTIYGIQTQGYGWVIDYDTYGDISNVEFDISSTGQIVYTSSNNGLTSLTFKYKTRTIPI